MAARRLCRHRLTWPCVRNGLKFRTWITKLNLRLFHLKFWTCSPNCMQMSQLMRARRLHLNNVFWRLFTELAAWQSSHSSSSSSGAFSWRGSVSSSSDSPPHAAASSSASTANRKGKFRSTTPSPPLVLAGSAPASFSGIKFHPSGHDDGIVSDESISESDEGVNNPSQVCSSSAFHLQKVKTVQIQWKELKRKISNFFF